jgi:CubicO group peptidase (beta-lactamase class C family)
MRNICLKAWMLAATLFAQQPFSAFAQMQSFSAEEEALYLKRFGEISNTAGRGLDAYDPVELVPGARTKSLPKAKKPTIAAGALGEAKAYAEERKSSAFIVWRKGQIEAEHYFNGYDATKPIISKSLAKPVTALLVGRAIQLGHIKSLDQPVADFITEWKGDAKREKMTIRHLLDMRTGFLMQSPASRPDDILNRAYLHPRHDEIIIRDYPLTNDPGTRYDYSNATSELIAPVIERATGKRYSAFLSEALLKPIGAAGGSVWINRPGGMAHSGCCLMLPAQSWLRMAVLLMNDGKWGGKALLPKGFVAAMRTPTAENPHYGLGVWVAGPYLEQRGFAHPSIAFGRVLHSEPYSAKDLYLFDGNSNQVIYMIPSQNLIVLRTGETPPKALGWDNSKLPNLLIRGIKRRVGEAPPEPQPKPFNSSAE